MQQQKVTAYSERTKTEYDSWEDLVDAEANGYCVLIVGSRHGNVEFANKFAGGLTKKQARNKAATARRKAKKDSGNPYNYKFFIRPDWKY